MRVIDRHQDDVVEPGRLLADRGELILEAPSAVGLADARLGGRLRCRGRLRHLGIRGRLLVGVGEARRGRLRRLGRLGLRAGADRIGRPRLGRRGLRGGLGRCRGQARRGRRQAESGEKSGELEKRLH